MDDLAASGADERSTTGDPSGAKSLVPANIALGTIVAVELRGNGDGLVDPGERIALMIPLQNNDAAPATALGATLSSAVAGVTIATGTSAYPDIAAAATEANATAFVFDYAEAAACGAALAFTLTVVASDDSSMVALNFTISRPVNGMPITYTYAGAPVAIPDGTGPAVPGLAVSATLPVVSSSIIGDIDFRINGTVCSTTSGSTAVGMDHSFVGDLVLTLISPAGTSRVLVDQLQNGNGGNSGNNFCNTVLDDASATAIQAQAAAAAPFTGTFAPANTLAVFNGEAANGNWALQVQDTAIQDTGSIRAFSLVITDYTCVSCPDLMLTLTGAGRVGTAYSQAVTTTGGTAPYSYSLASGSLPTGLTLAADGTLTGTPTAAGMYTFTVKSTATGGCYDQFGFTIEIAPDIVVAPSTLPGATGSASYDELLSASGGTGPYTFAVTTGTLPPGLTLETTGQLHGTPTDDGSFPITVTATDANAYTGTRAYTLVVAEPTIAIAPNTIAAKLGGTSVTETLTASGGAGPYTFAVTSGTLPPGLTLDASGLLHGIPSDDGSFAITVTATDANAFTGTGNYTLVVTAPAITLGPSTLAMVFAGTSVTQTFTAAGGTAPYTFSVSAGALPTGAALAGDGMLTGAPTAVGVATFSVTATDALDFTGTAAYSWTILAVLEISPATLANGTVGSAYSATLTASAGDGAYTFAVMSGTLPAGLALSGDGHITGKPTAAGTSQFVVEVTDGSGGHGTKALAIVVAAMPVADAGVTDAGGSEDEDAGPAAGSGGSAAGAGGRGGAGAGGSSAGSGGTSSQGDGSVTDPDGGTNGGGGDDGCSCRVAGAQNAPRGLWLAALAVFARVALRRRKPRASR